MEHLSHEATAEQSLTLSKASWQMAQTALYYLKNSSLAIKHYTGDTTTQPRTTNISISSHSLLWHSLNTIAIHRLRSSHRRCNVPTDSIVDTHGPSDILSRSKRTCQSLYNSQDQQLKPCGKFHLLSTAYQLETHHTSAVSKKLLSMNVSASPVSRRVSNRMMLAVYQVNRAI